MHPCLCIDEILDRIFEYLLPYNHNLAALALTCRAFTEPASEKLWRTLPELEHLLRCLPADCWEDFTPEAPAGRTIRFTRQLDSEDWMKIKVHRRRIREFSHQTWGRGVHYAHLLDAIEATLPTQSLFPNIRHLHFRWKHYNATEFVRWATILIGPRLTDLTLYNDNFSNEEVELLGGLDIPFANLRSLDLFAGRSDLPSILSTSSSFALALSRVEEIALPRATPSAWRHLASLPDLEKLTLYAPRVGDLPPLYPLLSNPFPALGYVHLSNTNVACAVEMLKSVPQWHLWRLIVGSREPETRATVQLLYQAVASRCVTTELEDLWIGPLYPLGDEDTQAPPTATLGAYALSGDTLGLLFPLQNLVNITLRPSFGFVIDDGVIRDVASAWPNVTVLRLGSGSTRQNRAGTTLNALRILAEHCPSLRDLMLPVNAFTVPPFAAYRNYRRITQTALTSLDVGISPITDSEEVARFISGHFTAISEVETFCAWRWDDEGYQAQRVGEEAEERFHRRWKEVQLMLRFSERVRREERYWAENSAGEEGY
uniref:F-box domain-containing protein n=1 Tax=Mycena chlorophos TaxID=658473 RepID=A0ABQ0LF19_MYCCL|nr:predicted protein [Mycena chlorophos]